MHTYRNIQMDIWSICIYKECNSMCMYDVCTSAYNIPVHCCRANNPRETEIETEMEKLGGHFPNHEPRLPLRAGLENFQFLFYSLLYCLHFL